MWSTCHGRHEHKKSEQNIHVGRDCINHDRGNWSKCSLDWMCKMLANRVCRRNPREAGKTAARKLLCYFHSTPSAAGHLLAVCQSHTHLLAQKQPMQRAYTSIVEQAHRRGSNKQDQSIVWCVLRGTQIETEMKCQPLAVPKSEQSRWNGGAERWRRLKGQM